MKSIICFLLCSWIGAVAAEQSDVKRLTIPEIVQVKLATSFRDCATCPEMIDISAGNFEMGSVNAEDEKPVHHVATGAFAIGKYHVTRGQFAAFLKDTGYVAGKSCFTFEEKGWQRRADRNWLQPGFKQEDDHPAVCINWHDAKAYTAWLAKKTGKPYRLLSESEWEYAARGGTVTSHYWDNSSVQACAYANAMDETGKKVPGVYWAAQACSDGYAYTSPVGQFAANAFGLYDMLGNAWQWVEDSYVATYQDAPNDGSAFTDEIDKPHVMRGGAWSGMPEVIRADKRNKYNPNGRFNFVGFRVARDTNANKALGRH